MLEEQDVVLDSLNIMRAQLLETMVEVASPDLDFGRMKDILAIVTFRATHSIQKLCSHREAQLAIDQVTKKGIDTLRIDVHANWECEKHFSGENICCVHIAGTLKLNKIQKPAEVILASDGTAKTCFMCSAQVLGETHDHATNEDSDDFDLSKLDPIVQKCIMDHNNANEKLTKFDVMKLP